MAFACICVHEYPKGDTKRKRTELLPSLPLLQVARPFRLCLSLFIYFYLVYSFRGWEKGESSTNETSRRRQRGYTVHAMQLNGSVRAITWKGRGYSNCGRRHRFRSCMWNWRAVRNDDDDDAQ